MSMFIYISEVKTELTYEYRDCANGSKETRRKGGIAATFVENWCSEAVSKENRREFLVRVVVYARYDGSSETLLFVCLSYFHEYNRYTF